MTEHIARIQELREQRPRSRALRWSILGLGLLAAYSWIWGLASGEVRFGDTFSARRMRNLDRFLGEIRPYPLQGKEFDFGVALDWMWERLATPGLGWDAAVATLAISVVAIVLAGIAGALLCLPAARTVFRPDAFVPSPNPPSAALRLLWRSIVTATRGLMVFLRAIPEYIWAFLFIKMLGVTAWPAVLALALHNAGILGRLQAEVIENVEPDGPRALRALGASRRQIAVTALLPLTFPRALLYFFYRWETCVREATVLGMLGVVSLGSIIQDARAGQRLDDMVFFVLLGAAIVVIGDAVSGIARTIVRRAS